MNVTYFIQLFDEQLTDCQCLRFNERTPAGAAQPGDFSALLAEAAGNHLVVIMPAASVVLHRVNLVANSRSQVNAALPFALEDELAEDIEEIHFAHMTLDKQSGEQLVATTSKTLMQKLFDLIPEHQYASVTVIPQILAVPLQTDQWSLFVQRDYALLRKNADDGYAMDAICMDELMSTEAELFKEKNDTQPNVTFYDFTAKEGNSGDHLMGGDAEALAVMARYCLDNSNTGLDLLEGEFHIAKPMGNLIRQWGMVAGLALLASVFYLVSVGVDSYHLSKERDQLDASMKNLYQQIFSEEVEDRPADRMRKKLIALGGKSQGADNFISVMLATGKEFLADKESSISRLRYTGNSMEVDLVTGTIEQLEKLQQQIASDTTRVQLKAVTNDNGKVRGRLVVSQGGGQS